MVEFRSNLERVKNNLDILLNTYDITISINPEFKDAEIYLREYFGEKLEIIYDENAKIGDVTAKLKERKITS